MGLQSRRRRAGGCLILVQLKAQIVVTNSAGKITGRNGERHFVFTRLQERAVEGLGIFPPHAPISVIAQGVGRDGTDGTGVLAIDANGQGGAVGAAQRYAQGGRAFGRVIQIEFDGPGRRPAAAPIPPHILTGCGGKIDPAESLVGRILGGGIDETKVGRVRHFLKEPVLVPIALADGVDDVVGEQLARSAYPSPSASIRRP